MSAIKSRGMASGRCGVMFPSEGFDEWGMMENLSYEEKFHRLMTAIRRSRQEHGDCKSGERYGGVPKACSACMAQIEIDEMLKEYKGRPMRLW